MTGKTVEQSSDFLDGRRILIVEDEYLIASELAGCVRRYGGTVIGPVARLGDAEKLLGETEIHAALLDINLRGAWSYPVLDRLKARGIPAIIVTGYERDVLDERFQRFAVVPKPFDAESLMRVVQRVMEDRPD